MKKKKKKPAFHRLKMPTGYSLESRFYGTWHLFRASVSNGIKNYFSITFNTLILCPLYKSCSLAFF